MKRLIGLGLIIFYSSFCLAKVAVTDIRVSTTASQNRVVFSLSGHFEYRVFKLSQPERIVVDIQKADIKIPLDKIPLAKTNIKSIRSSIRDKDNLRFVLDINQPVKINEFYLKPYKGNSDRLVLDLAIEKKSVPIVSVTEPLTTLRDVVVTIDPGHGGKDPGATGVWGTREKDVVLLIATQLKQLIDKEPGMHAELTRDDDNYIPLRGRMLLARKDKADMFVSIHADAYKNHRSQGVSVFALSARGASSEAARWLAEKENYSELGGVDLNDLNDKDNLLRSVLIDLSQTVTISDSLELGTYILGRLSRFAKLHYSTVEQARFMVLKSPDIPSILVETGFLSNLNEEQKLTTPQYQQQVAQALMQGIRDYFWRNPPRGTHLAAAREVKQRVAAKRG